MDVFELRHDWIIAWKFHLYTPQQKDAERVFAKVMARIGLDLRIVASGVRGARPGTWVRAQSELRETLGNAVVAALDAADEFGGTIDVRAPEWFDGGRVEFSGWISSCRHCELAAVEFELCNVLESPEKPLTTILDISSLPLSDAAIITMEVGSEDLSVELELWNDEGLTLIFHNVSAIEAFAPIGVEICDCYEAVDAPLLAQARDREDDPAELASMRCYVFRCGLGTPVLSVVAGHVSART